MQSNAIRSLPSQDSAAPSTRDALEYSRSTDVVGARRGAFGPTLSVFSSSKFWAPLAWSIRISRAATSHSRLPRLLPGIRTAARQCSCGRPRSAEFRVGRRRPGVDGPISAFLQMAARRRNVRRHRAAEPQDDRAHDGGSLGPITGAPDLLLPGHGLDWVLRFGFMAVSLGAGSVASTSGGHGGHHLLGDPAERMFALLLIQAPASATISTLFRGSSIRVRRLGG